MSTNVTPPPMPNQPPGPSKRNHTNAYIIGGAGIIAAAVILATGMAISSDGDDTARPQPTVTVTETVEPEVAVEEDATAETDHNTDTKVGEEARNGGAVVKVTKVVETDAITFAGAHKSAGPDAKYVIINTVVSNDGEASMDLTCSLPIVNALIDDQDRHFDTIEDLYDVAGNPECNVQLQPGFDDKMQFVYRVPKDAVVTTWEFSEYDLENEVTPTLVDLT
ncbi:hypothetical protein LIX60_09445 [Streptomyces sp. S07_1.15]|uniref:hypothetical protein n=1 Tax=Streptomyces sp. S07_1.15 TaxID=2873925 RepID=UPI001D15CA7D|nr:hypothetical protein [Streptomyces sp. S07_1.15]MCC3651686.1 hypothetical protein [Streptomyces sp. S07_1.15]